MQASNPSLSGVSRLSTYRRLLRYLLPYWGAMCLVVVGFVINALTEVSIAKLMQFVIDAINSGNQQQKNILPLLIVLLFVVRGTGAFMGGYFTAYISRNLVHCLRIEVFSHVLRLPARYFQLYSAGHVSAKITFNIEQVTAAATEALRTIIRDGLIVVGLLGWLLYVNWRLTLCLLLVVPLIGLVVAKASKRMQRLSVDIQNSMGDLSHITNEGVQGYQTVKNFGAEDFEMGRFSKASTVNLQKGLKLIITASINTPLVQLFMAIGMSIVVWIALRPEIFAGTTTGEFISYLTAAGLLSKPIKALTEVNEKLQRGLIAAESVFELLDTPAEANAGTLTPLLNGDISFNNVGLQYEDGVEALKQFSLTVPSGATVALVGRSGAGKTSLVNLLTRFLAASSGTISIGGVDINDIELGHLRKNIAVVGQQVTLFDTNVSNNIAYGPYQNTSQTSIEAAAKDAYAHDFITQLPDGYQTMLGPNGMSLSGGQRQRLAIARALLKDAPILILDEATSALDNESEYYIQQALEHIMANRTTFVIAHRLTTIERADLIVVMNAGQIVETGTHQDLLAQGGLYAQLHQRQFE